MRLYQFSSLSPVAFCIRRLPVLPVDTFGSLAVLRGFLPIKRLLPLLHCIGMFNIISMSTRMVFLNSKLICVIPGSYLTWSWSLRDSGRQFQLCSSSLLILSSQIAGEFTWKTCTLSSYPQLTLTSLPPIFLTYMLIKPIFGDNLMTVLTLPERRVSRPTWSPPRLDDLRYMTRSPSRSWRTSVNRATTLVLLTTTPLIQFLMSSFMSLTLAVVTLMLVILTSPCCWAVSTAITTSMNMVNSLVTVTKLRCPHNTMSLRRCLSKS